MSKEKSIMDFSLRHDAEITVSTTCHNCLNSIERKGKADDYDDVIEQLEKEAQSDGWRVVDGEPTCPSCAQEEIIDMYAARFVKSLRAQLEEPEFIERICAEAHETFKDRTTGKLFSVIERKAGCLDDGITAVVFELLRHALCVAVEEG